METDGGNLACVEEIGALIRTDSRGRARYDAAFRRRVVEAYEASGMSAMAFARHCGLKYPTLAAWVRKARLQDEQAAARRECGTPRFVVAEVGAGNRAAGGRGGSLELEVAPGMVARASDHESVTLLAELVRQLGLQGGGASC